MCSGQGQLTACYGNHFVVNYFFCTFMCPQYVEQIIVMLCGLFIFDAAPVSDSLKILYFWRIRHTSIDIFEESAQHRIIVCVYLQFQFKGSCSGYTINYNAACIEAYQQQHNTQCIPQMGSKEVCMYSFFCLVKVERLFPLDPQPSKAYQKSSL